MAGATAGRRRAAAAGWGGGHQVGAAYIMMRWMSVGRVYEKPVDGGWMCVVDLDAWKSIYTR